MANDLTFGDLSTILNSITEQVTGESSIAPVNTSEFITVAQTALKCGMDPLNTAISQVLSRTIFSNRPYYRKFRGMEVDNIQYGNHVRKMQMIDSDFEKDNRLNLVEGQSIDMYKVKKPKVLQTNFYGYEQFARKVTRYYDQINSAMTGPDQFGSFIAMLMQNAADQNEQARETTARFLMANLAAGVYSGGNSKQVVHLITEYNTHTGKSLTLTTVYDPANYPEFIKWVYGRVAAITDMLTERLAIYHMNVTGSEVMRHTPYDKQRVYLLAPDRYEMEARVLADTFHDNYLRMADTETINFWQSPDYPSQLQIKPAYMAEDGTIAVAEEAVTIPNLFGVITDVEAGGMTVADEWSGATPFNVDGGYTNFYWHFTHRYWNDFTENVVILLMD